LKSNENKNGDDIAMLCFYNLDDSWIFFKLEGNKVVDEDSEHSGISYSRLDISEVIQFLFHLQNHSCFYSYLLLDGDKFC
jgi:hypothetical protein